MSRPSPGDVDPSAADPRGLAGIRLRSEERVARRRRWRRRFVAIVALALVAVGGQQAWRWWEARAAAQARASYVASLVGVVSPQLFAGEWTPRAYEWSADLPAKAQTMPRIATSSLWTKLGLRAPWLNGEGRRGLGDWQEEDTFLNRADERVESPAWRAAPLRARVAHVHAVGGHPLAGILAEHVFVVLCDAGDFEAVRLSDPGDAEPVGLAAPDVDLYVSVEQATVEHADGQTKVDAAVRYTACANLPALAGRRGEPLPAAAWSRTVQRFKMVAVEDDAGIAEGAPLWRVVAMLFEGRRRTALAKDLMSAGMLQPTALLSPPPPPPELLLPYEPTPALPWPDGATVTQVASRRGFGCANDTRWLIVPAGDVTAWLAALRGRFAAAGWQPIGAPAAEATWFHRGDECFACDVASFDQWSTPASPRASDPARAPDWLPRMGGMDAPPPLRARYHKGLAWADVRARLASAPPALPAHAAWSVAALGNLPPTWRDATLRAPLAAFAGAVSWADLTALARAQAAAGEATAARATMGAALVQAQLATAFDGRSDQQPTPPLPIDRFDAVWREHAAALGLPPAPPPAASAADVAAVGGALVPADAADGVEVRSRDGFLWLAARADQPGFTAFWWGDPVWLRIPDTEKLFGLDGRFRAHAARRVARGEAVAIPNVGELVSGDFALLRADFAGREPRYARAAGAADAPPAIGLSATVVDDARLRVRAAGLR